MDVYKALKNSLHSGKFIYIQYMYLKSSWETFKGFVYNWLFDFLGTILGLLLLSNFYYLLFGYIRPWVILPSVTSLLSYSTFGYFRRSVILDEDQNKPCMKFTNVMSLISWIHTRGCKTIQHSVILPLATFDVQFFHRSIILPSVILPFVIHR
jgi:hypothetical protein